MTRLKRKHPQPLYVQLMETLRADILSHRLQSHQQIPSERELGARFHVSRMTVRQALLNLTREGLLYSRVGKGTFVREPKIDQQLKTLTGFRQEMLERGIKPSSHVLQATLQCASESIAAALRIAPESEIILLSRLRFADAVPMAIETAYLPHAHCPGLLQYDFEVESLYDVLERKYGYQFTHAEQTIEAALASPREVALLQLIPPAPVLVMERSTFTRQRVLIEYVHSIYRGDRYKFLSVLSLGDKTAHL